jgi:hypothetical protein
LGKFLLWDFDGTLGVRGDGLKGRAWSWAMLDALHQYNHFCFNGQKLTKVIVRRHKHMRIISEAKSECTKVGYKPEISTYMLNLRWRKKRKWANVKLSLQTLKPHVTVSVLISLQFEIAS